MTSFLPSKVAASHRQRIKDSWAGLNANPVEVTIAPPLPKSVIEKLATDALRRIRERKWIANLLR